MTTLYFILAKNRITGKYSIPFVVPTSTVYDPSQVTEDKSLAEQRIAALTQDLGDLHEFTLQEVQV